MDGKKALVTFYYKNGIAVRAKSVSAETSVLYSELELKESVQTSIIYYPSGKMREKEVAYFNRNNAEILTLYYENGNIKSISNGLEQTYKFWRENGTPSVINDNRNQIRTTYNEDGTMDYHETASEKTSYTYKDGKLLYYTVRDKETDKYKTYYANGKLKEESGDKKNFVPMK